MSNAPIVTLRLSALAVVLSLGAASPSTAQERARISEQLRHRDRLVAVELPPTAVVAEFTVGARPARAGRLSAPTPRAGIALERAPAPALPAPVPGPTMDLIGAALGGGIGGGPSDVEVPGPPVLDHIELSARRPWFPERANVEFLLPYDVNPGTPSVTFNKNFPGLLRVNLKLEEGRSYLIDFALSSWGAGTYRIEVEGASQEFEDPQGDLTHVLVAVQATESGWVGLDFRREGTGYYLYTVTADRVD